MGNKILPFIPFLGVSTALFFLVPLMTGGVVGRLLLGWDHGMFEFVQSHRTPGLDKVMFFFTMLGNWQAVTVGTTCAAGFFALAGDRLRAALLFFSVSAGGVFVAVMKALVHRGRPPHIHAIAGASGFSFPSGHAFVAFSFYFLLFYFLNASIRTKRGKHIALLPGAAVALGIGVSRVYVGVHWPSDVLAGWIAGAVWLGTVMKIKTV